MNSSSGLENEDDTDLFFQDKVVSSELQSLSAQGFSE